MTEFLVENDIGMRKTVKTTDGKSVSPTSDSHVFEIDGELFEVILQPGHIASGEPRC